MTPIRPAGFPYLLVAFALGLVLGAVFEHRTHFGERNSPIVIEDGSLRLRRVP